MKLMHTSKVIFNNQYYVVCLTQAGILVQSKRKGDGKLLSVNALDFLTWLVAFEEAIDVYESHALAKAIYESGVQS
jgi:hypothetical protein